MPADKGVNRMKIRNLCIFAAMLLAAATVLPVCAADVAANGDLNADGAADKQDVLLLQKHLLTDGTLPADAAAKADLTNDGLLNAADLSKLKQLLLKPQQPDQKLRLLWSDEFDEPVLRRSSWSYELGNWKLDASGNYITGGWGNNEQQFYTDQNATVHDGILTIAARHENYTDPV